MKRPDAVMSTWRRAWCAGIAVFGVVVAANAPSSEVRADETIEFDAAGTTTRVSLIGDSTLAGVRWYADYGTLRRFDFVLNAESCRRTAVPSCFSREGYRSANVVSTMRSLDGQLGELLVVMSGYNDPVDSIDDAIDSVVAEARSQGVEHVVWLTLRTSADVDYSDPQEQSSVDTFREYNEQLVAAAADSDGYLQIADWATYSTGATSWFEFDGVHLTPNGVDALTTFLTGTIERVLAGDDVSPAAAPWTVLVPGAEGEVVADVQQAVIDAGVEVPGGADGVYGNDTMIAVAEYQRRAGDLQVTGAVDLATAQSLGVFTDPDGERDAGETLADGEAPDDATIEIAPSAAPVASATTASPVAVTSADDDGRDWQLPAVVFLLAVGGLVVLRRRERAVVSSSGGSPRDS